MSNARSRRRVGRLPGVFGLWLAWFLGFPGGWITPCRAAGNDPASRPNILWLTCEDAGPHLGCYGDSYATTPALDQLASRSLRYRRVWSVVPVCAPARTAIITGRHPWGIGAEHMRSDLAPTAGVEFFPARLRDAGYYCVNNSKEDYNLRKSPGVWDESSPRAHWRNRGTHQPFFAVFNYTETHESSTRRRPHRWVHDPALVPVPPYMPATREVREGWAQYYDQWQEVDRRVAAALREVEEAGLAGDTVVFFFADHGAGMPRHKRSACDSGLRVPLILHVPPRWRHLAPEDYRPGGESRRLVSFVDLAPTVLSLAGVRPPESLEGRALAGRFEAPGSRFLFGGRGRMDERADLVRSVTDGRHVYVRNHLPHLPAGQPVAYLFQTPMTRSWFGEFQAGRLSAVQRAFWEPRASEELYDLESDPHETRNLAGDAAHGAVLRRLRRALERHREEVGDLGAIPESMRGEDHGESLGAVSPRRLRQAWRGVETASAERPPSVEGVRRALVDRDPLQRFWGAMAVRIHGGTVLDPEGRERLRIMLGTDRWRTVRIAAAEALLSVGSPAERRAAQEALVELGDVRRSEYLVAVAALQAFPVAEPLPEGVRTLLAGLPRRDDRASPRMNDYLARLLRPLLGERDADE